MKERALDCNDQCERGSAAIHRNGIPDVEIADDEPPSEDAQRLACARYKEN
jgi:hypothetical protein